MRLFKIAVALLLAAFMLIGCISCSDDTDTDVPVTDSAADSESEAETEKETEPEDTKKEDDKDKEDDKVEEEYTPITGEGKSIDIYLIAGQSNASGSTRVTNASSAYEWAPELKGGYSNVLYAGNSRSNDYDRDLPWQKTTLGLGISKHDGKTYMGPEAGMAKALSEYYNEETGRMAGIIKYAAGGTSLQNKTSGTPHSYGNWVSPSYAKHLGVSYADSRPTGKLYRNLLAQVEKNVLQLCEEGYTDINIMGIYWMQGCNDRTVPDVYDVAFKYFAKDIRDDLSELMNKYTVGDDDCGASEMPIIVGTISQSQNLTKPSDEVVCKKFIEKQKSFAESIENCYVVDNSQYAITRLNPETGAVEVLGSDKWHWNQADALAIGENVGRCILDNILDKTSDNTPADTPDDIPSSGEGLQSGDTGTLPEIDISNNPIIK